MNLNSILKREGIDVKLKLDDARVNEIATIISEKICNAFPEHNLDLENVRSCIAALDMYIADMPNDSSVAKYFYKNNSIYFNKNADFDTMDTLVIHECLHALQEIENDRGKVMRLGLYNVVTNKGQGINEAAVQLMAAKATNTQPDSVKYYNMDFSTDSPLYYPIETALISQIIYFTGSYPLFHSTLHSNDVFKNTFSAKCGKQIYNIIEENFDTLIKHEEDLSFYTTELATSTNTDKEKSKINKKIESLKNNIRELTISTQDLIIKSCFYGEFDLIRDEKTLTEFREKLYNFKDVLINSESYTFFNDFYCEMMNRLEEKHELIKEYGVLIHLSELQTDLLNLQKEYYGLKFFRRLFSKIKLLFEEKVREKDW